VQAQLQLTQTQGLELHELLLRREQLGVSDAAAADNINGIVLLNLVRILRSSY
jgi:hypothetical protein